jgi:hypothetical protein
MAGKRKSLKGPVERQPDRLKINGDWKSAVKKALEKERPAEGWPESDKEKSQG